MPSLLEIKSIAADTPVRTVTLSGMSVTVLFSTLDAANRLYDWWGGSFELSQVDIDEIEAILAAARKELMISQVGEIRVTAAHTIPDGCLLCDGATYERVDYPDLYSALAEAFIVSPDQFSLPDLRGKFVSGAIALENVGEEGGEATHTLDISEIPSHSHSIPLTVTTLALEPGEVTVLTPVPILTASTGDTGGSGAHNNLPPYLSLRYYIVAL